jgi:hypothetical protein
MRPDLTITVLVWFDATRVLSVRLYGTDHRGEQVDRVVNFPEPCPIDAAWEMVAKMNNSRYRSTS